MAESSIQRSQSGERPTVMTALSKAKSWPSLGPLIKVRNGRVSPSLSRASKDETIVSSVDICSHYNFKSFFHQDKIERDGLPPFDLHFLFHRLVPFKLQPDLIFFSLRLLGDFGP